MKQRSKYGMPPPTTRAEYEHNLFLLADDIERHKDDSHYLFGRYRNLGESLEHTRYLPNRRIELATIDEQVRLHANMHNWMKLLPPMQFLKNKEEGNESKS